jgi:hypothetical protein
VHENYGRLFEVLTVASMSTSLYLNVTPRRCSAGIYYLHLQGGIGEYVKNYRVRPLSDNINNNNNNLKVKVVPVLN